MGRKPTNGFDKRPQDINRKGRLDVRRGEIHYSDLLRKFLNLDPDNLAAMIGDQKNLKGRPAIEFMAMIQVHRAISAKDPRLLENLLDRVYGRSVQALDVQQRFEVPELKVTIQDERTCPPKST